MLHTPFQKTAPVARGDTSAGSPPACNWAGEFRDRQLEQRFLESRIGQIRQLLAICGFAATAAFFLLVVRDYLVLGLSQAFYWNAMIRCIGLVTGAIFQVVVIRAPNVRLLHIAIAAGMANLTTLVFLTWIVAPPTPLSSATLSFAVLLVYYLLVPCAGIGIVVNAVYFSVGTVMAGMLQLSSHPENLVGVLLLMSAANGLGFAGMRQSKRDRRYSFLAQEEANRVTEALTLSRQESRRGSEYQAWALDSLQVGVVLFDPDGYIHTLNRRAIELLALPPGSIIPGDRYETLIRFLIQRGDLGDLDFSDVRYHVDRLLRGRASLAALRLRSTGQVLEFTIGRLPDNSVSLTIFDASDRYALNRRLRHAVEVAGDGFAIYDANDIVTICSSRFAALYGLTVEQAIGMSYEELVERAYTRGVFEREGMGSGSARVAGQTRRRIPERMVEIRTTAGEWFLIHERLTPSGDLVVVRTNITARRRIEDELRRAKEEAERMLAELREAQANLILSEKMASLGSLVAGMSHEISTPLGIGVSAASHMAEEIARLSGNFQDGQLRRSDLDGFLEAATEATRIMQANLGRAARLIQAFKQVSADQSTDEVRSFDLAEYLREIMLSLAPALRSLTRPVQIDCAEGVVVINRPGALGQIITNLVMNALQHAFDEGDAAAAQIGIRVSRPREGRIVIEFSDNGRGIDADSLPRVFDPFFTTRRGAGGTGLGLHIAYNLVTQVLGGTIAVSSRPGEGTRFSISFPRDIKT
jgi:signal transduction histidine kinase